MTLLATEWACVCGRTNKASWVVCPTCEHRRAAADPTTPPAPRRGRSRRVLAGTIALALAAAVGAGARLAVERVRPDPAPAAIAAPAAPAGADTARYRELGRRLLTPGSAYRASRSVQTGPLTPEAIAAVQSRDARATPQQRAAELRAGGLVAGYTGAWEGPGGRLVVVVLHEFSTARGMLGRVDAQFAALRATYGPRPREVPPQLRGARGLASDGPVPGGSFAVAVVTAGGPRMATITLLTPARPTSEDITELLVLAHAQDKRL